MLAVLVPCLAIILLDFRTEMETTANAWVGVLGYGRSEHWFALPVYQNYVNFGSALPIVSHITLTPFAVLGEWFSVQYVQQFALTIGLVLAVGYVSNSPFLRTTSGHSKFVFALLFFLPTGYYFWANDWTEHALSSYGLVVGILTFYELARSQSVSFKRTLFGLWFAAYTVMAGHLSYVGVALIAMSTFLAGFLWLSTFRQRLLSSKVVLPSFLLVLLVGLSWSFSLQFLARHGVTTSSRQFSVFDEPLDLFSFGLLSLGQDLIGLNFLGIIPNLFASRNPTLIWPSFLVYPTIVIWRRKRDSSFKIPPAILILACQIIFLSGLMLLADAHNYPFRPGADYQFRDALLPLVFLLSVEVDRLRISPNGLETHRLGGLPEKPPSPHFFTAGVFFLATAVLVGSMWIDELNRKHDFAALADPGGCSELGVGTLVWFSEPIWRGEQPSNPLLPDDCSLLHLVENGQFSAGGWLKMRQTSSDGSDWFELENKVKAISSDPRWNPQGSTSVVARRVETAVPNPENNGHAFEVSDSAMAFGYERCDAPKCVLRLSGAVPADGAIAWNYDPHLTIPSGAGFTTTDLGTLALSAGVPAGTTVTYRTPPWQRISVLAAWALFFFPLVAMPLKSSDSRRVRSQRNVDL